MSNHVKIMAILVARPGKNKELQNLLNSMVAPSRKETGNLRYDLWRDRTTLDRFVLDELYADNHAVEAHRTTAHYQAYASAINGLAERIALTLDPVAVA